MTSHLHIYAPAPTRTFLRVIACPTCKQRRRMLVRTYEWYGPLVACPGCGDQWNDGEMCERPFRRGWREKAIARVKMDIRELRQKRS